jgi:hypothetical protein
MPGSAAICDYPENGEFATEHASITGPATRSDLPSDGWTWRFPLTSSRMENAFILNASPKKFNSERRAKAARRSLASTDPKPQLKSSTTLIGKNKNPRAETRGFLFCLSVTEPAPSPRLWATASGATPARHTDDTTPIPHGHRQPELSTLPETGTFYFALTQRCATPGRETCDSNVASAVRNHSNESFIAKSSAGGTPKWNVQTR